MGRYILVHTHPSHGHGQRLAVEVCVGAREAGLKRQAALQLQSIRPLNGLEQRSAERFLAARTRHANKNRAHAPLTTHAARLDGRA